MPKLIRSLKRSQRKHTALLAKVERTTETLRRRTLKLRALENTIAELERCFAEPRSRRSATGEIEAGGRRAQLIFNPASGRDTTNSTERLAQIIRSLRAHGIEATIGLKTSGKAARSITLEAVRAGVTLVIVAAGDGTIEDVASQLVGTSTVLGVIPIGTMNNVARCLGVPLEIDAACALIGMGTTRHIDIGRVHSNQSPHDEYFLESGGVGLSAIAALAGQAVEKGRWRTLPRALKRFFENKPDSMRIELDGTVVEASTRIVTVCNAPLMGNNLLAAPDAKMDDGQLDVRVYDGMGDAALVTHFLSAAAHGPTDLATYRAQKVRITTTTPVHANSGVNVSKELRTIDIEILPGALTMIVGNGIGLTVPVEAAPDAPTFAPPPPIENGQAEDAPQDPVASHA